MCANILLDLKPDGGNMWMRQRARNTAYSYWNNSSANIRVSFNVVSYTHPLYFYPPNVTAPLFLLFFSLPWEGDAFFLSRSIRSLSPLLGAYNHEEGNDARRIPICRCNLARDIVTFPSVDARQILRNNHEISQTLFLPVAFAQKLRKIESSL